MLAKLYNKLKFHQPFIDNTVQLENPDELNWDAHCELLVVGFGGAGAATALEAYEQGLDVLVLDRFEGGGATTLSGGIYYAGGGTATQIEAGVEDSPENMFNYLKQEVQGAVSDETLKRFCDQSLENYQWMVDHGVPFEASFCPFKTSYPPDHYFFYYSGNESFAPYSDTATPAARGHRARQKGVSGQAIYQPLKASALNKGIRIQNQSKVTALVVDKTGAVIGVKALTLNEGSFAKFSHKMLGRLHILLRYGALYWPALFQSFAKLTEALEMKCGSTRFIRASKGVTLATGGFYSNQKMIKEHADANFLGGSPLGTLSDDGSGILMAEALGAKTELMDSVSAWRFINPPMAFVRGLLFGPEGKRVCNEMLYGAQLGEQMMRDHDGKAWLLLDEKTYKAAFKDLTLKKGLWFHAMLGYFYLLLGVKKATSVGELAEKVGANRQGLEQSFADYNAIAESDEPDPKGKPKDYMPKIGAGPYYAINASYHYFFVPCPSLTLGGLKVDEMSGQVLNHDGQGINGLFAAGRTAVGIPSKGYVSGLSIADCIFSGRRVAQYLASKE
jgi:3-oxo-5alpha-steroid 4-dehydrogenase